MIPASLQFDFPPAWQIGLPLVLGLLALAAWAQRRRGLGAARIATLALLRAAALVPLVLLAARPVWVEKEVATTAPARTVVVLFDKSESMSLDDSGAPRYEQALAFAREHLWPALKRADLQARPFLFAEDAEPADGTRLAATRPDGHRSNLGGAIARALAAEGGPPLAVIALTDGAVNERADNNRALAALAESRAPFIGVGFGSETGLRTLSLRHAEAPPAAPPRSEFSISAVIEAVNTDELPASELVLLRDGQFAQRRAIVPFRGSRRWRESFLVTEPLPGVRSYEVRLLPPPAPGLKALNTTATLNVRIADEQEVRVLYVQGALTWDYKFINLALDGDPLIKLTGLTRTSAKSVFRQNIEKADELVSGFPTTIDELAPFRVVVLSNLKPADLSVAQQELLARYCGELGGGLLMLGGPDTFDSSWRGSRLEQALPVVIAELPGVQGFDRPFQIRWTDEALTHPVFRLTDSPAVGEAWRSLPAFTHYGRVDAAKPGAQVWALHPEDRGPHGLRVLMAVQRYGAGLAAAMTVQNFWRWRLAAASDSAHFDRFWRQLFRHLAASSRQDVAIHFADQELRLPMEVKVTLERQPSPQAARAAGQSFTARVEDAKKKVVREQGVELAPSRPVDFTFRATEPGIYQVSVLDERRAPVASRPLELRDTNVEFLNAARNMETLRQWAALSDGLAVKIEDCRDAADLVTRIESRIEQARKTRALRHPAGVNGWVLAAVLGALGLEWVLRKQWGLR